MGRWKYKITDKCKTEGCDNTPRAKGYCITCYSKIKRKQRKNKTREAKNEKPVMKQI